MPPDQNSTAEFQCSLLIFLATDSEKEGMENAASARKIAFERIKKKKSPLGECLRFGWVGNESVIAVCPTREQGRTIMRSQGRLGTASRGGRYQQLTNAQAILQLGMAFGVDRSTQQLGDVLVSTSLLPYDNRIVRDHPDDPDRYLTDYGEVKLEPARSALVKLFRDEASRNHPFRVHVGAILSGSARIQSATFRSELLRAVPVSGDNGPIVGGEMEGVGLLAASATVDDPIWCFVKGISDFADAERDEDIEKHRPIACRNAADFVLSALQNGGLR